MAASTAQIARVRRMTAEPTTSTYSDADIRSYIEAHPLPDDLGRRPWTATQLAIRGLTDTPATVWTPTYDLNAAAADIWDEKAAKLVANGQIYETDSAHLQAMRQVRFYRSKRSTRTIEMVPDYPARTIEDVEVPERGDDEQLPFE